MESATKKRKQATASHSDPSKPLKSKNLGKERLKNYAVSQLGSHLSSKVTDAQWWRSDEALLVHNEYPHQLLHFILGVLLKHDSCDNAAHLYPFIEEFVDPYEDSKYYAYKCCLALLTKSAQHAASTEPSKKSAFETLVSRIVFLLLHVGPPPTSLEDYQGFLCVNDLRTRSSLPSSSSSSSSSLTKLSEPKTLLAAFSELWLCVLKYLPEQQPELLHSILADLQLKVLPYLVHPIRLMDFLTDAYNAGGLTSLLALQGLFYLMHHHNLDYPDFYVKLYSLLDAQIFHVKYRFKFFKLLNVFLASSHLPVYMLAAFLKRLSRLALYAPPSSLLWFIPFTYNLLKRVPATRTLIHRTKKQAVCQPDQSSPMGMSASMESQREAMGDAVFSLEALDPASSHALDSSLWELAQLRLHAYSKIASFAKVFSEKLTKPEYDLQMKPSSLSYHSIIQAHVANAALGKGPVEAWALASPFHKGPFLL